MSPDWFWKNLDRYDGYERSKSQVYLGEYAARDPSGRFTLRAALAEAAYLTSLERNGDIVRMASFAPLLGREGFLSWNPNLIYFNADPGVYPIVSYEVQRLFSHNGGDRHLSSTLAGVGAKDRLAVSAVRDTSSGDVILKIVNGDETPKQLQIALKGAGKLSSKAALTVLSGKADDINDYTKKTFVRPESSTRPVSDDFGYSVPANSLTVFRIPRR
jgi:alpha-N-arabinofuranosidase